MRVLFRRSFTEESVPSGTGARRKRDRGQGIV